MITRIDHIAVAVQDIQDAIAFFQNALGMKVGGIELEEGGRTKAAFIPAGGSEVELLEPQDADSGLSKFLAKRGEGIHHICFEVNDIESALERLKENGAQLIDESPRVSARGYRYAFVHPKSAHGVLIELYQRSPEAE